MSSMEISIIMFKVSYPETKLGKMRKIKQLKWL